MSETFQHAEEAIRLAAGAGLMIVTAESCTGGLVAAALTDVPGSSKAFDRGFVTYSNEAKSALLGVPPALIEAHGAVSEEVARAMAESVLRQTGAGLAIAVTGIAGPDGGTAAKPVGLVHFAAARRGEATLARKREFGDVGRDKVRRKSVIEALELLAEAAGKTAAA